MKIKVIMSDKAMSRETMDARERMLKAALSSDAEVSVDCIKKGPDELDCNTDEAFAAAEMVKESIRAEKEGYDAIVIYCFSDVGIDAIRENVRIPVIGPGETSLAAASMICNRFTVLTSESINIPRTYRRLMRNGIAREKMAAVRALDIPIGRAALQSGSNGKISESCLQKSGGGRSFRRDHPGLSWNGRIRRKTGKRTSGEDHRSGISGGCVCGIVRKSWNETHPGGLSGFYK